jgi:hypothetical protein
MSTVHLAFPAHAFRRHFKDPGEDENREETDREQEQQVAREILRLPENGADDVHDLE